LWAETKATQRDARRDAILRAATRCINQRGYSGASMAIIARELGLSYNALYHYFESKEEILEQAFARVNRMIRECVAASSTSDGNGLHRLSTFVASFQRLVQQESPPAIALVAHLPKEKFDTLIANRAEIVAGLEAIVRDGIADRSIAHEAKPEIVVGFLLGALESTPYWQFDSAVVEGSFRDFVTRALAP
jgi:AcrR family transcriptional regulator